VVLFVGEGRGGVNGGGTLFDTLERDFEVEKTVEVRLSHYPRVVLSLPRLDANL